MKIALHFTIKPVIYGSLAARLAGVGNISTLTGLGYPFLAGGVITLITRRLYRLALRRATKVFFHNPEDRRLFLDGGLVTEDQSAVVGGSGLRLADYPLASYGEAVPGRFLFVGRLLVHKGIREFVAAARIVKAVDTALSFHVLGPLDPANPAGINAQELAEWVEEGCIVYDGVTTDVRPHLRRAAVVVLPSYREGCPRVLLEAGATGRALVGADVPGVRQLIAANNGILVPPKVVGELVAAMTQLARPVTDLETMGRASREVIVERFAEEIVAKAYLLALSAK